VTPRGNRAVDLLSQSCHVAERQGLGSAHLARTPDQPAHWSERGCSLLLCHLRLEVSEHVIGDCDLARTRSPTRDGESGPNTVSTSRGRLTACVGCYPPAAMTVESRLNTARCNQVLGEVGVRKPSIDANNSRSTGVKPSRVPPGSDDGVGGFPLPVLGDATASQYIASVKSCPAVSFDQMRKRPRSLDSHTEGIREFSVSGRVGRRPIGYAHAVSGRRRL
jgi:hypothetical protein